MIHNQPKVWKASVLSEYVSLTLDLIHSAFSEGATGVGEGGLVWFGGMQLEVVC